MANWRPLRQRTSTGAPGDAVLHEGIPEWLKPSFARWLNRCVEESFQAYTPICADLLHSIERMVHITLDWEYGETGAQRSLVKIALSNKDDLGLEIVDCVLALRTKEYNAPRYSDTRNDVARSVLSLERMLEEAGSEWKVAYDQATQTFQLESRVDETIAAAAEAAMSYSSRSSDHLRIAWHAVYGRDPDASKAYLHAVKAVEAAARPIVTPNDALATLGKMIAAMRGAPHKWTTRFTDPGVPVIAVVVEMMKLIWTSQLDRHGTDDESVPLSVTREESQDALHLAAVLVQWFQSGGISMV